MKKRILSILLAAIMIFSLLPVSAFAETLATSSDNVITKDVITNTDNAATAAGVTVHNVTWDDSENCAVFSGNESYLEIPSALTTLDASNGFAVVSEVWIDSDNATWARVFDFNDGTTQKYYTFTAKSDSGSLRTIATIGSNSNETKMDVSNSADYRGKWVKLIWVVMADGSMCLYHDVFSNENLIVQCSATDATRALLTDASLFDKCLIGASAWGSGDGYFKGKMRSFSVHSLPAYSITATGTLAEGTLSVPEAAFSGEYVTVTGDMPAATEDGVYRLDSITVTDADGGTVTANKTGVNSFTFRMPDKNVTVSGTVTQHTVYSIENQVTGGTLFLEQNFAAQGDPVSLAATADEGTHLSSFTVTDAGGSPVPVTDNTFVMPASNVTVTAAFEAHSFTVIADGKAFKRVCAGEYCELHTAPTATLTLSENGFKLYEEKLAWKEAGLAVPDVQYYSGETLLEKKPTTVGSYVIKATIDGKTASYPFTLASAPSGYTTDENFRMAYKGIGGFMGYVKDNWQQIAYSNGDFKIGIYNNRGLTWTATPEFVADGQAIQMTYTVTNNTNAAVSDFRFYLAADTAIGGNSHDDSLNTVQSDDAGTVVIMDNKDGINLFALSTTEGGTAVPTAYSDTRSYPSGSQYGPWKSEWVSYCDLTGNTDPSTVHPIEETMDSAFVMYFPLTTLQPGESAEYNFVIGMGSEETIQDIIRQVRAALGLVDYANEKITGLDPNTTYIFECGEDEQKEQFEITSDRLGEIPLGGTDDQQKAYNFIGRKIKYWIKGSTEEPQEIDVAGRPQTPNSSEILPGDQQYVKPEDVLVDTVTETSITILPVKTQEYQYSTDSGETWTAVPENGEITGLTEGSIVQIRTRIAATDKAPASEYSEAVSVTLKKAVGNLDGFSATGFTGFQDGQPHSITVTVPEGATVVYSEAVDAAYSATNPTYIDPGEYTVYYRVTKDGCYPTYGSEKVVIENGFNMLGKALKGEALSEEQVEAVKNLFELTDIDNVRTIKLKVDFTADAQTQLLQVGTNKEIVLDLNGHVINGNGKQGSVINVPEGAKLTLEDNAPETEHAGYVDENGLWHLGSTVPEGCTAKTVKGGVLTGGQLGNGGGVVVNGTFNMNGGTIAGNKATHGGGVDVNGTFNMNGGTITGNYASVLGGGVNTNGTVNMYGGEITGNTAATNGGGVCYNGKTKPFTLGGSAKIAGNTVGSNENNLWLSYMGDNANSIFISIATGDNAPVTEGENKMSVGITLCSDGYNKIPQNYLAGRFTNGNNVTEAMKDCFFADNDDFVMNFNNNNTPDVLTDDYLELLDAPTYSVTNSAPESSATDNHGYLTVNKATAAAGGTVTVTVTPSEGYQLKTGSLKVTYNDGSQDQTCQLTQDAQDKTKYTFTMPAYAVTVTAAFEVVACSTYKFEVTVPETLKVNEEHTEASVKLCVDAEKSLGYEHVLIKVEMTATPDGSAPKILATDSQSVEWNIAEVGQWGPSEGFAITSDYEATTPLTLKFDKAGTYTAEFTLVDLDNSNAVLCESTATVTVSKNPVTINATAEGFTYGDSGKTGYKDVSVVDSLVAANSLVATYYKETATAGQYVTTGSTEVPTDAGNYKVVLSVPETNDVYTGSKDLTFTVAKEEVEVVWTNTSLTYDAAAASAQLPSASYTGIAGGSTALTVTTTAANIDAGTYTATAEFSDSDSDKGNYTLTSATTGYTVAPKEVTSPTIALSADSSYYTGSEIKPSVTVKDGETVIPDTEYTISYSDNVNAGTSATVTIADKTGGNYAVSSSKTFTIKPRPVTLVAGSDEKVYDGAPLTCTDFTVKEDPTTPGYDFVGEEGIASVTMTQASSITNVGTADNVIDTKTAKQGTNLNNYDITTEKGTLTIKALAETAPAANEGYTLNYVAETLIASTGYEVSSTNGDTATALTDNKVAPGNTAKTYYIRKLASDTNHANSVWTEITISARPATPNTTVASTTANSITVSAVTGAEYKLDNGSWQDSNEFTGLSAASSHTVYVRIKAVANTSFASEAQTIQNVCTNAAAPTAGDGYSISYPAEEVTVEPGYEISLSNSPFSAETLTGRKMIIEPNTTYYIRKAASGSVPASAAIEFTTPARPAAVTGVTAHQETIVKKDDAALRGVTEKMEYRIRVDGGAYGDWITGSGTSIGFVFDATSNPITRYNVEVRTKATATAFAGETTEFTFLPNTTDKLTVSFGNDAASQQLAYGAKVDKPADPEKTGYTFGGWYADEACTQAWNFGTDTVTDNMTLYPKWIRNSVQKAAITGNVTESGSGVVSGATVELYLGTVKVAATVTNASGNYSFDNVENGVYNIVVTTADGKTKTELVTVDTADNFTKNVELPNKAVSSVVEVESTQIDDVKSDISKTVVGGLDTIAAALTPNDGQTITIKLTVEPKSDTGTEAQREIKTEAGNGKKVEFLDMSLWQITTTDGGSEASGNIGSSNTQLLTIVIPFDFTDVDVSSVMILRKHGTGNAEKLTKNPASGQEGFKVDRQAGTITVYAMKFSDYALAYAEQTYYPGGGETTYAITGSNTENGKLTLSKKNASAGSTVTITVTPDEGFKLDTLTVKDITGKELTLTKVNDTTYTFKMPSSKVTISATFTEIVDSTVCPQDETCVYAKFTDADTKAWYHDGVHFCVENGYMQGVSATAFDPAGTTTRAMIVTMLWRMEGKPVANYAMSFKDVKADQWYTEAIRWAQSTGVVEGYSAEAFGPDDPITREQMATILYRYAKYHEIDVANTNTLACFTDVNKVSSWALDAMKWANAVGLVQGRTTTTLVPEVSITRAEAATMVQRYCKAFLK